MKLFLTILICLFISAGYAVAQVSYKGSQQAAKPKSEMAEVIRVIDGDTIEVKLKGEVQKVRLIGIDTPELKDSSHRVKCFAYAAWSFTEDRLLGRTVILEADPTQADKDRYGRLLRYFIYNNGNFGEYIIKKGFAYEYLYHKPYKYQKEFKAAQMYADESKWGLWDKDECK